MLFNSFEFAIYLPIVFIIYWFIRSTKIQNVILLFASYFFYGLWDWRFLLLLVLISLANYSIGIRIGKTEIPGKRKAWLIAALIINLGVLIVFKYFNFFIDGFIDLISLTGYDLSRSTTRIILPIGISFYTFLSLSYILDIFKRNLTANKNLIHILLTLSFFPIILAGPIQRPSSLLPQIASKRQFNYDQAVDGLKQILWGLFAKVVIADNLGVYVDDFFNNQSEYPGSTLLLGMLFYTVQIYADFSGYSNIAIGVSKLLGFNLMQNFNYPYFAGDITEFWKRWHISLTTWFRDYVFLPMSFNLSWKINGEKVLNLKKDFFIYILASIVTWLFTGLWHGANYTFIVWGIIHSFFLIVYKWQMKPRKALLKKYSIDHKNKVILIIEAFITLCIVMVAWVFFRANTLKEAFLYLNGIFSKSVISIPEFPNRLQALISTIFVLLFFIIEWNGRNQQYAIAKLGTSWGWPFRFILYYAMIMAIFWFTGNESQFIYFQF